MTTNKIKSILLAAWFLCSCGGMIERVRALGPGTSLLVFLALSAILLTTIVAAAWTNRRALRWIYAAGLALGSFMSLSEQWISQQALTYDAYISLVQAAAFAGDALTQHTLTIAGAAAASLLLLLGVAIRPAPVVSRYRHLWAGSPLAALFLLVGMLYLRGGMGSLGLPPAYPPLAFASLHAYEIIKTARHPRSDISLPRSGATPHGHIVLLVDESVSANYLDLATPNGVPSGLLDGSSQVAMYNYGYAAAISNCSASTNANLRYGGTRDNYRSMIASGPSVWAYAKRAGMRTVYIDAQRTGGKLQNLMDEEERVLIDRLIQFDDVPVVQRDMAVADTLATLLNDEQPTFIYVNKVGAHFPVAEKYPAEFARYYPALPRTTGAAITDATTHVEGGAQEWERYRNSYRNTLLWNVNTFFKRLLREADLSRTTLLYTSDHGQDLHERGNPGASTHCNPDPVMEEGLVPLVVLSGPASARLDWKRNATVNRNHVSHYQIFPTLLDLMGFEEAQVEKSYGPSLLQKVDDAFSFNILFNARFGQAPNFRHIDLNRISLPKP